MDYMDIRQSGKDDGMAALDAAPLNLNKVEESEVLIPSGGIILQGNLALVEEADSIVLFAHGSGSSRFSRRNQYVAKVIRDAGISTLLFDLLTRDEEAIDARTRHLRFDIDLLASRLVNATRWIAGEQSTAHLKVGYFGSSTGAAAALVAATRSPIDIRVVVSRGGRPDLAGDALEQVAAPTLLIVGEYDKLVINLNREALARLNCEKDLQIVPGATHLFEEPGALEIVAGMAANWFSRKF